MPQVLINKSYKQYNYLSRYEGCPYYYHTIDEKYVYGRGSHLKDIASYSKHKVTNYDTLDSLALKYYNNPTLFWIIADFNHIQDPYLPLTVGSYINIPAITSISFK